MFMSGRFGAVCAGVLAALTLATTAQAQAPAGLGASLYSLGGEITIDPLPATAGLRSELWIVSPEVRFIANNERTGSLDPVQDPVTIGPYPAGTELIFEIRVASQGTFQIGPGSRNPDGLAHAVVTPDGVNSYLVGFEDLYGGGDRDYDDNVFRFTGSLAPVVPPDCSGLTASGGDGLRAGNHKFQTVTISGATDVDASPLTYAITGVRQDEPVDGPGSGNTAPDARIVSGNEVDLRAERDGAGNGRVYEIDVLVTDEADGATCTGTVTVGVPHDASGAPAINDGAIYSSL
jgi:hypothetical protein